MDKTRALFLLSLIAHLSLFHCFEKNRNGNDEVLVFGYGSLLSQSSRSKTLETIYFVPGVLKNYHRFWGCEANGYNALAIEKSSPKEKHEVNGIVIVTRRKYLEALRVREKDYNEQRIPLEDFALDPRKQYASSIERLYLEHGPHAAVLTYTHAFNKRDLPSEKYPVFASYVNTVFNGLKDISSCAPYRFAKNTDKIDRKHYVVDKENPVFKNGLFNFELNSEIIYESFKQ